MIRTGFSLGLRVFDRPIGSPSGRSPEIQTLSHGLVAEDRFLSKGVGKGWFTPYLASTATTDPLLLLRARFPALGPGPVQPVAPHLGHSLGTAHKSHVGELGSDATGEAAVDPSWILE